MSSVITTAELDALCQDFSLDTETIKPGLRNAKYVLYGDLVKYEKSLAQSALKKEVEASLEEGERVELNSETNRYEIVEGEEDTEERQPKQELDFSQYDWIISPAEVNGQLYFFAIKDGKTFIANAKGEEFGKEYDDIDSRTQVNGLPYFRAWKNGKSFIANAKGERFGEGYVGVFSPAQVNGLPYFRALKDGKIFIANAKGEEFGEGYVDVDLPVQVNGQLYFCAFMKDGKSFIANAKGEEFGKEYDYVTSPTEINGQLYFCAIMKDGKQFIADAKGERFGEEYDSVSSPTKVNGQLYFRAIKANKDFIANAKGERFGEEYEDVGAPTEFNGKLAYPAKKDGKQIVVIEDVGGKRKEKAGRVEKDFSQFTDVTNLAQIEGKLYLQAKDHLDREVIVEENGKTYRLGTDPMEMRGHMYWRSSEHVITDGGIGIPNLKPEYHHINSLTVINDAVYFTAEENSERFVADAKGNKYGENYDQTRSPKGINGVLHFVANQGRKRLIVTQERPVKLAEDYDDIGILADVGGKLYFTAQKDGKLFIANVTGQRFGEEFRSVGSPIGIGGRLFFRATKRRGNNIIVDQDGKRYGENYHEVGEPCEVDGKLAYPAINKDGKQIVVFEDVEKPEKKKNKPAKIETRTFKNHEMIGQPIYINGRIFFETHKDNKTFIVDEYGNEYGKEFHLAWKPASVEGKLHYVVRPSSGFESFIINENGTRYGEKFFSASNPQEIDGKLFYVAESGRNEFIADANDNNISGSYHGIGHFTGGNGHIYFEARLGSKPFIADEKGNKYGQEFDDAAMPKFLNGHLYFKASKGGESFIADESGKKYFTGYDNVNYPTALNGRIYVFAEKGEKNYIVDDTGREIPLDYKRGQDLSVINGKLAFTSRERTRKDDTTYLVLVDVASTEENAKLDLLNLIHDPDEEGVKKFFEQREKSDEEKEKQGKTLVGRSHEVAYMLNRMIREVPDAFLATMGARRDRASDILAQKLISKTFPEIYYREQNRRNEGGFFGFMGGGGEGPSAANPEDYLSAKEFDTFEGGGREMMDDNREVMEFRNPVTGLIVTGLFGKYENGRWSKSYLPLRRKPLGASRETTVTLPHVRRGQDIVLPKTLDSAIVPERVRGIKKNGTEVELTAEEDSLGMSKVLNLPAVEKVAYSINFSEASEPMAPVSVEEYAKFRTGLERTHGKDMTASLASLPEEVDAFLTSESYLKLAPRERVMAIERFVRSSGYYDFDNQEMVKHKRGKSIEDKMMLSEMRIEELKSRKPDDPDLQGRRWAGVCADFAEITAAVLRRAGFATGVAQGFALHNEKTAKVKYAHGTAFVVWPDNMGNMRAVTIDGTPDGLAGISLPSLEVREATAEKEMEETLETSKKELDEILRTINSGDADAIRQLDNGKLENILNVILTHGVKKSHAGMLEEMLNFYWYGGLEKMEDNAQGMELRKTMEDYLINRRVRLAAGEAQKPAGTELFNTVEGFATRFQKSQGKDYAAALDKLDAVTKLAKEELDPMELRAMTAIVTYLRGKNMAGHS